MKELLITIIDWIDEYLMTSNVTIDGDVDVDAWMIIDNDMCNYVKFYN